MYVRLNGETSAAVDILATCCKSVITVFFIFAVFDVPLVIAPLSGAVNYVFFAFITQQQQIQFKH